MIKNSFVVSWSQCSTSQDGSKTRTPRPCKHLDLLGSNPASHFSPSRADPPEFSKFAHNIGFFLLHFRSSNCRTPPGQTKLRLRRPERRKSAAPTPPWHLWNSKGFYGFLMFFFMFLQHTYMHHVQTLETSSMVTPEHHN